jgi:hypothetical protein
MIKESGLLGRFLLFNMNVTQYFIINIVPINGHKYLYLKLNKTEYEKTNVSMLLRNRSNSDELRPGWRWPWHDDET